MIDYYILSGGHTMKREEGLTPNGNELNNRWVLRDVDGRPIDYDTYRYDLIERNKLTILEKMEI